jgi:hypothetical protein
MYRPGCAGSATGSIGPRTGGVRPIRYARDPAGGASGGDRQARYRGARQRCGANGSRCHSLDARDRHRNSEFGRDCSACRQTDHVRSYGEEAIGPVEPCPHVERQITAPLQRHQRRPSGCSRLARNANFTAPGCPTALAPARIQAVRRDCQAEILVPRPPTARVACSRAPTPSRCSSCRSTRWQASCAACR